MILDGLDRALEEAARPKPRRPQQRRTRIGWRQITVQVLYVIAVTAFVLALLFYGGASH